MISVSKPVVVLEDTGDGCGHQGLSESHHIADEYAIALVQMMSSDLDRRGLEVEQAFAEHLGNPEFGEAGASFVGQVVGHLEVNVVREGSASSRAQLSSII